MKEVFFINTNYKNAENKFEIKDDIALITVLKKNGSELVSKIDVEDLDKVKGMGNWFAEWNKEFNNYIVQNISSTNKNKKAKPLKQNLQAAILYTNPKAPIRHINGDTLDNRKSNLEIVERNTKNDTEILSEDTIALILKDKFGNPEDKALISKEDLELVSTDEYSWVTHKTRGEISVVANTPEGRIQLDVLLMNPTENQYIHHINLNPLDNRRCNLENKEIV